MAGAGWRAFTVGQLLTSAQVQTYLQDQAVQVHASAAARSSALGTAVSAGMVSYRSDDKALELYAGTVWQPVMQGRNAIINGGFDIWQRGTSLAFSAGAYVADRWRYDVAAAIPSGTISQQTFTPGAAPVAGYESAYFERFNITAHNGCTNVTHETRVEDVRGFAGQTVTLSFFAKADAAATLGVLIEQNFGSGGSSQVTTALPNQSLTSSWVRFTTTFNMPSISGKTVGTSNYFTVKFVLPTSGANVRVGSTDIWGVQLEAGSVATPFVRAGGTLQGELAACQRYYYRSTGGTGAVYAHHAFGAALSATAAYFTWPLPVRLRALPSSIEYSGLGVWDVTTLAPVTSLAIQNTGLSVIGLGLGVASGLTAYRAYHLISNNDANGFVAVSAEL